MKRGSKRVSLTLNSIILISAALVAHTIAMGAFISLVPFVLVSIMLVVGLTLLSNKNIKNLHLIFLVIGTQLLTHFLLGSGKMRMSGPVCGSHSSMINVPINSSMNSTKMFLAHMICGLISYLYIKKSEAFWAFAGYFVIRLLKITSIQVGTPSFGIQRQRRSFLSNLTLLINNFLTEAANRLAAPPSIFATI